ncbi:MAG: hypothetical protein HJJLKODD_00613 [Phycisphaerae bacterium]|nr:hypothetical protein [Phycisphaerae bacterium]
MKQRVLIIAMLLLVTGCQQPAGEIFPVIEPAVVWPAPPEATRIRLVGTLSDSRDLKAEQSSSEIFKAALRGPRPPITLAGPHGVALLGDVLLAITDSGAGAVHIIDLRQRTHTVTYGSEEARLAAPVGVVWMGEHLLVSDGQRHEMFEFERTGRLLRRFGETMLVRPVGMAYDATGDELYVVDGGTHTIKVLRGSTGELVRSFGQRGSGAGELNFPTHIAFDGEDRLAVADSGNFRVQLFNRRGELLASIGRKGDGAGDFALPKGVAFDSAGRLYVVDAQFENFQIFDRQGRLLLAVGEEGVGLGQFSLPAGIFIDHNNRIWVADSANRRLQVFEIQADRVNEAALVAQQGVD